MIIFSIVGTTGFLKKCESPGLSRPFLTQFPSKRFPFPSKRFHMKGQGFGNKMYISDLVTDVGSLYTVRFKNRRRTFRFRCTSKQRQFSHQHIQSENEVYIYDEQVYSRAYLPNGARIWFKLYLYPIPPKQ